MSEVFHLVYISKAVDDLSYTDIREILDVSKKNNLKDQVSGLLILRDDYFLQLLEGPEKAVRECLGRILLDDRNYSLRLLIEAKSDERLMPEWSMAFHDGDITSRSTEDLVVLFEACVTGNADKKHLIMPMLRKFKASAPELK